MSKSLSIVALVVAGLALLPINSSGQGTAAPAKLLRFCEGGVWGVMDSTGKVVLRPSYDDVWISEGIIVTWGGGLWGPRYLDLAKPEGFIWSPQEADVLTMDEEEEKIVIRKFGPLKEGLARVIENGLSGFIDKSGKYAIKPQFLSAKDFSEGVAAVMNANGLWGYVGKNGAYVIPARFTEAYSFQEGLAIVSDGLQHGYIEKTGSIVIKPQYVLADGFSEGLAGVGVSDTNEKPLPGFLGTASFRGKWGYINKTGQTAIGPQFEEARRFSDSMAAVQIGGKWGYIDRTGRMVISTQFETAGIFSEGLAAVQLGGRWGYIDKTGAMVIKPQFDWAGGFSDGLAAVWLDKKMGYIFKTGEFFWRASR